MRTALPLKVLLLLALVTGCTSVPITGRRQLSLVPESQMNTLSVDQYRQLLRQSKLSTNQEQLAMVRRVGTRIADSAEQFMRENGMEKEIQNYKWEFNLIQDDKTVNAFCMPGGKIAFYTGILPLARDDAGVAVVMGHEVAHALAKHSSERMSQLLLSELGGAVLSAALSQKPEQTQQLAMAAYGLGSQVGVLLPYSRKHEGEADRIGLILMARAGYDPHAATGFWERMGKVEGGARPPEFLSTHPEPQHRISEIEKHMPEAMQYFK